MDGEKGPTLKGERIAEEFQSMVEEYIAKTYARRDSMTALAEQRCKPCEGGVAPLSPERSESVDETGRATPGSSPTTARSIRAEWKFRNFYHAMSFVNAVAHIANAEDHHPDMEVGYGYCRMTYNTHAIGGLSQNDFICAAKVDALPRT